MPGEGNQRSGSECVDFFTLVGRFSEAFASRVVRRYKMWAKRESVRRMNVPPDAASHWSGIPGLRSA